MKHSLLHFHFESALRALRSVRSARQAIQAVYASAAFSRATPAARLTLLWRTVMREAGEQSHLFTESRFRQIVRELLAELTTSGIEHVDLRIGASARRWRWMRSAADGIDVFRDELARHPGSLSVTFLAGLDLTKPRSSLDALFTVLSHDSGVIDRVAGVDINLLPGDRDKFTRYLPVVRQWQDSGLKVNLHLGELFGNDVSRWLLARITPDRIGHGVLLLRDPGLVQQVLDQGLCLDMCPVSNTRLGVVDWRQTSPARHALRLGIPVSINTDDPVLFGNSIGDDLRLSGLTEAEIGEVTAHARKHRYAG